MIRIFLLLLSILSNIFIYAQNSFGLTDGFQDGICRDCRAVIQSRPKEVLFGIQFREGDVYFSISSETWFNKMFSNGTDGITTDIVSRDQFDCGIKEIAKRSWNTGTVMQPVYLSELKRRAEKTPNGGLVIKLGAVPTGLKGKELEGNLVIVRNNKVCFYTGFTNIDRSLWNLLDMGLFTDSLVTEAKTDTASSESRPLFFTRKSVIIVPFQKNKATYSRKDIKPLYDSLNLQGYKVKKIMIRAFSSVEGPYATNLKLQKQRAQSILNAIQAYQKENINSEVSSAENWVEFVQSISNTPFSYLKDLSKEEVKNRLMNKALLDSLEPILSAQRKAIITIYLDSKSAADHISNSNIIESFKSAIRDKNIDKAAAIQRSVFERVADNRLPSNYLDDLEIPTEKYFSRLLNNKQAYKYLLKFIGEDEALAELKKIELLDPANGKVKYNICALQLRLWQFNEREVDKDKFLQQISALPGLGIPSSLVNRLMINYKILLCEIHMKQQNYEAKDRLLEEIKEKYVDRTLSDDDLLSLGKYFCWYAQYQWANEIIRPRMDKLDVGEDLLFFYLNLSIFNDANFMEETNSKMLLNAISINNQRFCRFFNSISKGGISMQLLMDPFWKKVYCENCNIYRYQ